VLARELGTVNESKLALLPTTAKPAKPAASSVQPEFGIAEAGGRKFPLGQLLGE
jgi:hypothetical protein